MLFSKRRSRRNPLQRLNDQRRSLVLAGLAVGAAVGAAVFRRGRRGEEGQVDAGAGFGSPVAAAQPEAAAPVAPVDSGPTPAVEVPPAASESELEDVRPINAAPGAESAEAAPTVEPATGELSAEEASILAVLAQSGRVDDDRTAIAVATSLEREVGAVTGVLRKLGAEGVVSGELRTASGEEIWAVTERGVRRLGAQS
ncbi:MAG TPA: hypothetical protein VHA80_00855 [Solirubrobacterales bacterium]|nr:hypothetical protein [Solirubrobacterales bacterium]